MLSGEKNEKKMLGKIGMLRSVHRFIDGQRTTKHRSRLSIGNR